jgi:hypothetical protein
VLVKYLKQERQASTSVFEEHNFSGVRKRSQLFNVADEPCKLTASDEIRRVCAAGVTSGGAVVDDDFEVCVERFRKPQRFE